MSDCEFVGVKGPEPALTVTGGVKKDLDKHVKRTDAQCAEEILMQMVRTRTTDAPPQGSGAALPDLGDEVCAVEPGTAKAPRGPRGKAAAGAQAA
eukprot:CAMPEP_0204592586 /NCGR_PEP_ID=MMETSP0661-20131031/51023_1 /ASSEMBLY_ACC=CAM_ASM_000606 /TAXON_ID=109239 /ORGANISM="Alexandrium margalefi, Strain AMGDE01CS-322" /LENGTH=94 /DNA_ID=CAMNT_0051602823 /DNA_START=43 /DNA_END=323 /DNA_ORIENTATION=-